MDWLGQFLKIGKRILTFPEVGLGVLLERQTLEEELLKTGLAGMLILET